MGEKPTLCDALTALLTRAGVCHFSAAELTYKGSSHYSAGPAHALNSAPPAALLPSLVSVAVIADALRSRYGRPLRVLSAYRSPAYNRAVGGAVGSFHLRGRALDLAPVVGTVADLHHTAAALHSPTGPLSGGLGFYPWGVHVDSGSCRCWGRNLSEK